MDRRQMFGCPCGFVGGLLFCGLHEQRLVLRLAEEDRRHLIAGGRAAPFAPMGAVMREYVVVDDAVALPAQEMIALMEQARAYAASLPPKESKPRVRRSKPSAA